MAKIIQIGDDRLRSVCEPIAFDELTSEETKKTLGAMTEALNSRDDGVAISAPQIGVTKRIFAVSSKIFDEDYLAGKPQKTKYESIFFINPIITKKSKKMEIAEEGCLSIPNIFGKVARHKNVTVEAINEKGEKVSRGAGGLLARIFQHEIDHLDGILFIDKAVELKEISEKAQEE